MYDARGSRLRAADGRRAIWVCAAVELRAVRRGSSASGSPPPGRLATERTALGPSAHRGSVVAAGPESELRPGPGATLPAPPLQGGQCPDGESGNAYSQVISLWCRAALASCPPIVWISNREGLLHRVESGSPRARVQWEPQSAA